MKEEERGFTDQHISTKFCFEAQNVVIYTILAGDVSVKIRRLADHA